MHLGEHTMLTVIADVAGQFDSLIRLVDQLPKNEKIVLVGDLIDRGHFSFEVVEWAMSNSRVTTLLGNHEHMMLDYYEPKARSIYPPGIWKHNGGSATIASYSRNGHPRPPANHLAWIANLPLFYWSDDRDLLVSHAPLAADREPETSTEIDNPLDPDFDTSLIWNRGLPVKRDYMQVFGHNSHWGLRGFLDKPETNDEDLWALCIDQSATEILTGFRWPSGELVEEPYLKGSKKPEELSK
jgi:serine/threonine protein phosphatase 1